jgi:hypothetical protein
VNYLRMLPKLYFNFTTPAAVTTGADPGTAGGGGSPTGGGGTGAQPGAQPNTTPASINWDSAPQHFREGYNKLKSEMEQLQQQYAPWKGLNVQPGEVQNLQHNYQQVYGEMKGIGNRLGINEAEITDAVRVHGLLPVLDQLRREFDQAQAANNGDQEAIRAQELEQRIQDGIQTALSPIQQRENQRLVHEANTRVENTITQMAIDSFKTAGLDFQAAPPELKEFILTGVTEALKYDDAALKDIKFNGKTAGIQRAFQTFQAMWDSAYLARRKMEGGMAVRPPAGQQRPSQGATGKQPSLEDMINDPNSIRSAGGRPAYST